MRLIYIPLDERPCNYYFAERIARGSEVELIAPEREAMGAKKTPGDFHKIRDFMLRNAKDADAYVVSLDMLLYGGILPSRLHNLSDSELEDRLSVLKEIKTLNSRAKIYAFALIMRCPKYSSSDEEPDYYERCGREIFLTGQIKHKLQLGLISEDEADEKLSEYSLIIGDSLVDFESRRAKNRDMLIKIIGMLGNEIDYLIIPQDDSAEYGYTSMDREQIKRAINANGLCDVAMYPGADEVGMTLLARAAVDYKEVTPRIFCDFANSEAENMIPLYEDRPLGKTLPHQLESAGCIRATDADSSDITLFLNYPAHSPVEVWQQKSSGYGERNLPEFIDRIAKSVERGRVSALADGAYCNGGDSELLELLSEKISLLDLSAYAGWNTSSNTLGTVICQAVFVWLFGKNCHQRRFLAERIYEDVGYCGFVRAHVTNDILPGMGYGYFDAGDTDGEVANIVKGELDRYIALRFPEITDEYAIKCCRMPWKRMFEVDLSLTEREMK